MPLDPTLVGGAISAGGAAFGGIANAISTASQNKKSREFSREMYERQRTDNLAFWNMQNEYNSPQAQMARFQAAGLNPNLIYGQGNSGPASSIQTPDVQPAQFRTPEWGDAISSTGLHFVNAMYDLDIKQAQAKNLEAQNQVIMEDALLKQAQRESYQIGSEKNRFGLEFEKELRSVSADARREQLRQLKTSTDLSINKDAREAALNSSNVAEAAERMASLREGRAKSRAERAQIRQAIVNMQKDGVLKEIEIGLRRNGINPNDPMWTRVVGKLLSDYFESPSSDKSIGSQVWKWFFK